jgi:cysteine desulfurase family protein
MVHYSNTDKTGRSRLYLDNAATSFPKPPQVLEAMTDYALRLGASAGRGAYREAVETGAIVTGCRHRLNQLFNGENANHFIFTLNCSDALNLAIKGLVDPLCHDAGRLPHAICTHIDHNSILRPLNGLVSAGLLTQSRVAVDPGTGMVDPDNVRKAIRPQTRLIATTHGSNVTGTVQPIREIGRIAREHAIPFIVDAAQSAGHVPIDVREDCIDLLAAPGHKGLLGPLGTGFLYIRPGVEKALRTIREGGTGSVSELDHQPDFMPDKYEPGSHNAIGIAGLSAGIKWVLSEGVAKLAAHESELCATFINRIGNVADLRYFGPRGVMDRMGLFSVRIADLAPEELSAILETYYGILTRSGLHCAPLAHQAIGTAASGGTTRISFGSFHSLQDVNFVADALVDITRTTRSGRINSSHDQRLEFENV